MATVPTYTRRLGLPEGGLPSIGGVQPLSADAFGTDRLGGALERFGAVALHVRQQVEHAQQQTTVANATTDFLTALNGLEDRSANDPDYQGAPGRFVDARITLEQQHLERIDDPQLRATTGLQFRRASLAAFSRVRGAALKNEADANAANLDQQEVPALRDAATATTPELRAAAVSRMHAAIDGAAGAGWITAQNAEARKTRFGRLIDNRDVMEAVRNDPAAALERLKDPSFAPSLDPVTRESYINGAVAANDERAVAKLQQRSRFKPEIASLELGRIVDVRHADAIFTQGIIPQESGGNPRVVSPAGALGLAQLMPDTARDMAKKLGLNDVAGLDDAGLRTRLLDDSALNGRLGLAYWREMLARYEGNVPLALAAYNAGPRRADAWKARVEAKHGPAFSAQQLVDTIGIAETKNYVTSIYGRLGAGTAGAGLSPGGMYRATVAVGSEMQSQAAAAAQVAKALASTERQADNIAEIYKAGYAVDPAREQAYRQTQQAAAERGDAHAQQALRDLDEAKAMAPFHRAAWGMPQAALEQTVDQLEAAAAAAPNVSPQQLRQLQAFRAVRDEIRAKRNSDPIGLGEVAGFYPPVALDPSADPGSAGFRAALRERGRQGAIAAQVYLGSASALKPEELRAFKDRWAKSGPDEQFRLLQAFGDALPEKSYSETLRAVVGNDATAEMVGRLSRTRPELAREILQGHALMATKEVQDKAALVRPALAAKLGGQIYPNPEMQDAVVNAALALYTARRGVNGALYDATDSAGVERAIEEITGPIVKRNGLRTPIAPGLPPHAFRDALDNLDDKAIALMGGAYGAGGRPIEPRDISDRGQLVPLSPGSPRYLVQMPAPNGRGAPVVTYDGLPLIFDMRQIVGAVQVPGTPYQRGMRAARGAAWERMRAAREEAGLE